MKSSSHFFDNIFSSQEQTIPEDVGCIAVQHILPSTYRFILYLNNIFNGKLVILAKPKSIDHSIKERLTALGVDIKVASRDTDFLVDIIKNSQTKRSLILDIGGYFSHLASKEELGVVGVIEDTENGHKKYHEATNNLRYPVISVARSELKKNEDALVGHSIVHATDSLLRYQNKLL